MARAKKEAALTPEERLQAALVPDWEWPYKPTRELVLDIFQINFYNSDRKERC